eukprot:UN29956
MIVYYFARLFITALFLPTWIDFMILNTFWTVISKFQSVDYLMTCVSRIGPPTAVVKILGKKPREIQGLKPLGGSVAMYGLLSKRGLYYNPQMIIRNVVKKYVMALDEDCLTEHIRKVFFDDNVTSVDRIKSLYTVIPLYPVYFSITFLA